MLATNANLKASHATMDITINNLKETIPKMNTLAEKKQREFEREMRQLGAEWEKVAKFVAQGVDIDVAINKVTRGETPEDTHFEVDIARFNASATKKVTFNTAEAGSSTPFLARNLTFNQNEDPNKLADPESGTQQANTRTQDDLVHKWLLAKPDLPTFGNPNSMTFETWIRYIDDFLQVKEVPEKCWLAIIYPCLAGSALENFRSLRDEAKQNNRPWTYDTFKRELRVLFNNPGAAREARDELMKLVYQSSPRFEEYIEKFLQIRARITQMTEVDVVYHFCSGLKGRVQIEVLSKNPQNLQKAKEEAYRFNKYFNRNDVAPANLAGYNYKQVSCHFKSQEPIKFSIKNSQTQLKTNHRPTN